MLLGLPNMRLTYIRYKNMKKKRFYKKEKEFRTKAEKDKIIELQTELINSGFKKIKILN